VKAAQQVNAEEIKRYLTEMNEELRSMETRILVEELLSTRL
jgi:hypothetical protein